MTFGIAGLLTSLPHFIADEKMPTQHAALTNTSESRKNNYLCHPDSGLEVNSTLVSTFSDNEDDFDPLPDDNILDWSNLKQAGDDILK